MKTFKKLAALFLALMMAFTLFACGGKESVEDKGNSDEIKSSNEVEDVLKAYFEAIEKNDADVYLNLLPEKTKTAYTIYEGNDLNAYAESNFSYFFEGFEAEQGSNIRITVNTTEISEMSDSDFEEVKETYEYFDINDIELEKGSMADFEIAVDGDNVKKTGSGEASLIKENGEWKVYKIDWLFEN